MMYSGIISAALMIVSLIIQGHSSFDSIRIAGVKPDILFVVIVYLSYSFGSFYGEVSGFIGGILHDAVSNSPLGLLAFPKMALGLLVGFFGRDIIKNNILTVTLLLFAASLVKGIVTLFMCYIFHQASVASVLSIILPESFYNALLAPPLFFIFDKLFARDLEKEA